MKKSDIFHISMFYLCEECEENILKLFNIASVWRKMSNENSVCTVVVKYRKQMWGEYVYFSFLSVPLHKHKQVVSDRSVNL